MIGSETLRHSHGGRAERASRESGRRAVEDLTRRREQRDVRRERSARPPRSAPAAEGDVDQESVLREELGRATQPITGCARRLVPADADLEVELADGVDLDLGVLLDGPTELRQLLLGQSDSFLTTVTEKLLTYALGRGLEATDAPYVRQIKREAADENYAFASLIQGIVTSTPFQMRMAQ